MFENVDRSQNLSDSGQRSKTGLHLWQNTVFHSAHSLPYITNIISQTSIVSDKSVV